MKRWDYFTCAATILLAFFFTSACTRTDDEAQLPPSLKVKGVAVGAINRTSEEIEERFGISCDAGEIRLRCSGDSSIAGVPVHIAIELRDGSVEDIYILFESENFLLIQNRASARWGNPISTSIEPMVDGAGLERKRVTYHWKSRDLSRAFLSNFAGQQPGKSALRLTSLNRILSNPNHKETEVPLLGDLF